VGYGSFLLSQLPGAHVTAIDGASTAIEFGRQYWASPSIDYRERSASGWDPDHEGAVYDLVVSFETFEQLPNPERFAERLWRGLRPGGVFAISSLNRAHVDLGSNPYHIRHFTASELKALVTGLPGACGVRVLGQEHDGPIIHSTETCSVVVIAVKDGPDASETMARVDRQLQTAIPLTEIPALPEPAGSIAGGRA